MEVKLSLWKKTRKAKEALLKRLKAKETKDTLKGMVCFGLYVAAMTCYLYIMVSWFL